MTTATVKKISKRRRSRAKPWQLYWVESDGYEDCFVVARNARSACRVEIDENGFGAGDVRATRILTVSAAARRTHRIEQRHSEWPGYAHGRRFFEKMGARFRTVEGRQEMLLEDVVYEVEDFVPCSITRKRSIGFRAVSELRSIQELSQLKYHEEDKWDGPAVHLITGLGMCLASCQLIEHYIAHSFLLGVSKQQKRKYETLNDLIKGWRRKTLGNMLRCIEEAWEIEPTLKAGLELFLECRNRLVHGITTDEQFDIRTHWGREELVAFLSFFDIQSRVVKAAFRSSYYASIHFAIQNWGARVVYRTGNSVEGKKGKRPCSYIFSRPKRERSSVARPHLTTHRSKEASCLRVWRPAARHAGPP